MVFIILGVLVFIAGIALRNNHQFGQYFRVIRTLAILLVVAGVLTKCVVQVNAGQEYVLNQKEQNSPIDILNASMNKKSEVKGSRITTPATDDISIDPGREEKVFYNGNIYGVTNGHYNSTQFVLTKATLITRIENYHYFNNGTLPGTIALINEQGQQFGPWSATGTAGQGGVQNAYWVVRPNINLPAGTYTVYDSDPGTWSMNAQSAYKGFTTVWALQ